MRYLAAVLTIFLALSLIIAVIGCGGDDEESTATPTKTTETTATPEPTPTSQGYTGGKQTFKVSHGSPPGTITDLMFEYMDERLKYYTDGQVKLEIFPLASLYGYFEEWDACVTGALDMFAMGDAQAVLVGLPDFMIAYLGFFWGETPEEAHDHDKRFQEHPEGGKKMMAQIEKRGLQNLGMVVSSGINLLIAKNEELPSLMGHDGMKVRTVGGFSDLLVDALNLTGVVLDAGEVNIAFEQGLIDLISTSAESVLACRQYEIAKYGCLSDPVAAHSWIVTNVKLWNSLSSELQDIIMNKVMPEVQAWREENSVAEAERCAQELRNQGMIIHTISLEERAYLRQWMYDEGMRQGYFKLMDQQLIELADHLRAEPYDTGPFFP